MCLCHLPSQPRRHGRRQMLRGVAVAALAPLLTACDADDWWSFNLIPESQVLAISAQSWSQLRASVPQSQDAQRRQTVRRIAEQLITANGLGGASWQVELFASPQVNAFALPGGRIGVFEGMFRVAANPAQLAAVIGHEIGHVVAHHARARLNAKAWQNLGLQVLRISLG